VSHPLASVVGVVDPAFDPWQAIDEHPDLQVRFDPVARLLGGGFHVGRAGQAFIVVDPDLDEPLRRAVLTHELVHHERGGGAPRPGAPPLLEALVDRDERRVEAEVARRLVPPAALARLVAEVVASGGGLDAHDVADHFGVPVEVAALALHQSIPSGSSRSRAPGDPVA